MTMNTSYPTVATIIGCPETLGTANGLVATPIGVTTSMMDTSSLKDPVKQAVLDNMCGKLSTTTPSDLFKCDVCGVTCNAESSFQTHINGSKHAKKLKSKMVSESVLDHPYIVEDKETKSFQCTLCNALLNAHSQIAVHLSGSKHKQKVEMKAAAAACKTKIDTDPAKQHVDATPNLLYCAACNISVNSPFQLQQHTTSKKHINKVNGCGKVRPVPYYKRRPPSRQLRPYMPSQKERVDDIYG